MSLLILVFSSLLITPATYADQVIDDAPPPVQTIADFAPAMVVRGEVVVLEIPAELQLVKPSATYWVEIHSTVVVIGSYDSDASGALYIELEIPPDMLPGYHTLHILGPGRDGKQLDIYDLVFVVASMDDYDGDGIPNDQDSCTVLPETEEKVPQDCSSKPSGGSKQPTQHSGNSVSIGSGNPNSYLLLTPEALRPLTTNRQNHSSGDDQETTETGGTSAGDVLGTASDDVVIINKSSKEPPKQTFEMGLIFTLTAIIFLLMAGLVASKWYAKQSD